jgi:hypothetical protein
MTSRTTLLLAVALAGCGETEAPLCAMDTTVGAPVAMMAGTWTGSGIFRQTWNGKTTSVPVDLNLEFDQQGVPGTLPALGMISPWKTYAQAGASLRTTLEGGGTAFAYCGLEADGSANLIDLGAVSRCGNENSVEWRYQAHYHFADLLHYEIYDYSRPDAPEVMLEATDSYLLGKLAGHDALVVRGRATGTTDSGQPVELRFDATLERGEKVYGLRCQLGRTPAP